MKSRIWRLAGVGLLCVSVSAQALADEPQNRGPDGGGPGAGRNIRAIIRGMAATISRVRRTISRRRINRARRTTRSFVATTAASSSTTASRTTTMASGRTAIRIARRTTPTRCASRHRRRNCRPTACRSSHGPTPCARPRNRVRVTTATSVRKTVTTISIGRPTIGPTTIAGRDVRTDMAMVGARARNIGRGM